MDSAHLATRRFIRVWRSRKSGGGGYGVCTASPSKPVGAWDAEVRSIRGNPATEAALVVNMNPLSRWYLDCVPGAPRRFYDGPMDHAITTVVLTQERSLTTRTSHFKFPPPAAERRGPDDGSRITREN